MSTPKPGQIRCPTCHRSTPPAAFCTQCGSPIPSSARTRPRGMDRDELEERIRMRRPGDAPFRRGSLVGGGPDDAQAGQYGYQPFRPEPEDALAVREGDQPGAAPTHVDHTPPDFDQPQPEPPPRAAAMPARGPDQADAHPEPAPASVPYMEADEPAPEPYPYPYFEGDDDEPRRGGGAALPIIGFVALCALALAVGVVLSGMLGGPNGVGQATPSSSASASQAPSVEPTPEPTPVISEAPSGSPGSSGGPIVFPDGFSAETQPCDEQPTRPDGCDSSGTTVSGGSVWVWVGFENGDNDDVLGVTIVNGAGSPVGDGSIELRAINCGRSCNGYVRFQFGGLAPGDYAIRINRNGHSAAEAVFEVTG